MTTSTRAAPALWVCSRKGLIRVESVANSWQLTKTCHLAEPVTLALHDARDGALYAALRLGHFGPKLQRSRDGGESWQEISGVRPSAFGFAVAVHPQDPDCAWFVPAVKDECRVPVGQKLVVTRTGDGGRTFTVLDAGLPAGPSFDLIYRHALVVDASGRRLAMASTTGNLWISEDGGEHWQLISAHLPPVNALIWAE